MKRPLCGDGLIPSIVGFVLLLHFDLASRYDGILRGLEFVRIVFCIGCFIDWVLEAFDCGECVAVFLEDDWADAFSFVFCQDVLGLMWCELPRRYCAGRSPAQGRISRVWMFTA